jgi:hypothetical protein
MRAIEVTSTAILSLLLGIAAPAYAWQDHPGEKQDHGKQQQNHESARPAQQHPQQQREPQRAQQQQRQPDRQQQQHQGQTRQQPQQNQQQAQRAQQQPNRQARQPQQVRQQPQHAQQQQDRQARQTQQVRQQPRGNSRQEHNQQQQRVRQTAWQQHRAGNWGADHRNWQQRGGYHGYRIPEDRFRGHFGPEHGFRMQGLPFMVVGGYPRFQYGGYWLSAVDPWPESWASDWYDTDDVYVTYVDNGYYLYDRRYPSVGIAISISM